MEQFYSRFQVDEQHVVQLGFNPYDQVLQSGLEPEVVVEGRGMINLASNNYRGLAMDPRVKQGALAALNHYGASMCGTPVATGNIDLYKRVGSRISQFLGLEALFIMKIILSACLFHK